MVFIRATGLRMHRARNTRASLRSVKSDILVSMDQSPTHYDIRPAQLVDEPEILEICHRTGDMRVDRTLFGLRWCLDYLWHDTENCFSAVELDTGRVVGYILGTLDSSAQAARFKQTMIPKIRTYWQDMPRRTIHDWRFYAFVRWFDREVFTQLYSHYPAHLHINLLPEHQRRGIGERLLGAYEDNLRDKQVPGYHLGVGADNQVGIGFYNKMELAQLDVFPKVGRPLVIAFGRRLDHHEP